MHLCVFPLGPASSQTHSGWSIDNSGRGASMGKRKKELYRRKVIVTSDLNNMVSYNPIDPYIFPKKQGI